MLIMHLIYNMVTSAKASNEVTEELRLTTGRDYGAIADISDGWVVQVRSKRESFGNRISINGID